MIDDKKRNRKSQEETKRRTKKEKTNNAFFSNARNSHREFANDQLVSNGSWPTCTDLNSSINFENLFFSEAFRHSSIAFYDNCPTRQPSRFIEGDLSAIAHSFSRPAFLFHLSRIRDFILYRVSRRPPLCLQWIFIVESKYFLTQKGRITVIQS